jgi:hypothetical protein
VTAKDYQRREIIGAALFNAVINAALGWLLVRTLPQVPVLGVPSVLLDSVLTAFFIALPSVPIIGWLTRRRLAVAAAPPATGNLVDAWGLGLRAALVFAMVAAAVVVCLGLLGLKTVSPPVAVAIKTLFALVAGGAICAITLRRFWPPVTLS